MSVDESKLIFIISQPRSGSTLTQKLLSNNKEVDTVSEPWLLLPLLSILKPEIIQAQYNYPVALKAFNDYLNKRELGATFKEELKKLILSLYRVNTGAYFIDKTPRYYEILSEIISIFPNSQFVILKRHPLASLYSMVMTWAGGGIDLRLLQSFKRDFLNAPILIQQFCDSYGHLKNVNEVKYEDLVSYPEKVVGDMYSQLGLPYHAGVLDIKENSKVAGIYGDDVYKKKPLDSISDTSLNWYKEVVKKNELCLFFNDYQEYLTESFLEKYGYSTVELKRSILTWRKGVFNRLL